MILTLQSPASRVGGRYVSRASYAPSVGQQPSGSSSHAAGPPTTQQMDNYKAKALEFDRR